MRIVDTNIILRYVLRDHEEMYAKASRLLEKQEIFIPLEVVAEVVYVLEKVYHTEKNDIRETLLTLSNYDNLSFYEHDVMTESLMFYCDEKLDYIDAMLCAYKKIKQAKIDSFDKRLKKVLQGITTTGSEEL